MAQRFKPAFPGEVPTLGHGVIGWMTDMLATPDREEYVPFVPVSYTHLTLPTNREV